MSDLDHIFKKDGTANFLEVVHEFYRNMKAREITLIYEGEITHKITQAFSLLAESSMAKDEEAGSVQRKVFHVMIESLQNISKHSDSININESSFSGRGIFMVSKNEQEYSITTGNVIKKHKLEPIRNSIDRVNSMDKDALNELYMKQISEGELSEKGGAGLGFIDIVKKTGRKLDYHFLDINDEISFFILTSYISRN
jgi:hypothetical protein